MSFKVTKLYEGGALYCAGINVGDEIVAVETDGIPIFLDSWKAYHYMRATHSFPCNKTIFIKQLKAGNSAYRRKIITLNSPYLDCRLSPTQTSERDIKMIKMMCPKGKKMKKINNIASKPEKIVVTSKSHIKYSPELVEAESEIKLAQELLSDMKAAEAKAIASGVRGKLFNHLTKGIEEKQEVIRTRLKQDSHPIWVKVVAGLCGTLGFGIAAASFFLL